MLAQVEKTAEDRNHAPPTRNVSVRVTFVSCTIADTSLKLGLLVSPFVPAVRDARRSASPPRPIWIPEVFNLALLGRLPGSELEPAGWCGRGGVVVNFKGCSRVHQAYRARDLLWISILVQQR